MNQSSTECILYNNQLPSEKNCIKWQTCIYRFALFGGRKLYRITVTDTDIFIKHLFDFPSRPFCFSDFKSLSRKVQWEVNILKNFIGSRNRATKGGSTFKMKKKV